MKIIDWTDPACGEHPLKRISIPQRFGPWMKDLTLILQCYTNEQHKEELAKVGLTSTYAFRIRLNTVDSCCANSRMQYIDSGAINILDVYHNPKQLVRMVVDAITNLIRHELYEFIGVEGDLVCFPHPTDIKKQNPGNDFY